MCVISDKSSDGLSVSLDAGEHFGDSGGRESCLLKALGGWRCEGFGGRGGPSSVFLAGSTARLAGTTTRLVGVSRPDIKSDLVGLSNCDSRMGWMTFADVSAFDRLLLLRIDKLYAAAATGSTLCILTDGNFHRV